MEDKPTQPTVFLFPSPAPGPPVRTQREDHLFTKLMQEADKFLPPIEILNPNVRPPPKKRRKGPKMALAEQPADFLEESLKFNATAPPNPSAIISIGSNLVTFLPTVPKHSELDP